MEYLSHNLYSIRLLKYIARITGLLSPPLGRSLEIVGLLPIIVSTIIDSNRLGHKKMAEKVSQKNRPFCIIYDKDRNFMFSRSEELTCGPMYARAIFEKLTRVGSTDELLEEIDEDYSEEKNESITDLQQAIYCFLRDIDRKDHEFQIASGQGMIKDIVRVVSDLATFYLMSYPDNDDTGSDGALHNLLYFILAKRDIEYTRGRMTEALKSLEYRINQMSTADKYLSIMQIPAPNGQSCADFRMDRYERSIRMSQYEDQHIKARHSERLRVVWQRSILFPYPMDDQGRELTKGFDYLAAAFDLAQIPIEVVNQKLDALVAILDSILEAGKELILSDPEIVSKRKRAYIAFGVALEDTPSCHQDHHSGPSTSLKRKYESIAI